VSIEPGCSSPSHTPYQPQSYKRISLEQIPIRLNHLLQSSLRAKRSNLGALSARSVEIASSRTALLAMTVSQLDRNLL
jgi:hypothetical protein